MRPIAVCQASAASAEPRWVCGLCMVFGDAVMPDYLLSEAWPPPTRECNLLVPKSSPAAIMRLHVQRYIVMYSNSVLMQASCEENSNESVYPFS